MIKQKVSKLRIKGKLKPALFGLVLLLIFATVVVPRVQADQFDQQIQTLQQQNAQNKQQANQLQAQATSYQDTVNQLQSQITSLQNQISTNQAKSTDLQTQINVAQQQLDQQKKTLGEDIKAMYLEGQISTLEMLATSKDLSDFVDKQQYRSAVQDKVKTTLNKIADLKHQLSDQKQQVDALVQSQQVIESQVASDEAQQNQLLSYTEAQKAQFDQQIQATNTQINQLRLEQIAANTNGVQKTLNRGSCGGGYPDALCYPHPQDSIVDPWHMYNRECVSYTAWRASQESSVANALLQAHNFGNAGDWPGNAQTYGAQYGVTVSTTPQAGDIAIRPAIPGVYVAPGEPDVGHAMYVEAVSGAGSVVVSEYNEYLDGTYSEEVRSTSGTYHGSFYQLQFIHFP